MPHPTSGKALGYLEKAKNEYGYNCRLNKRGADNCTNAFLSRQNRMVSLMC